MGHNIQKNNCVQFASVIPSFEKEQSLTSMVQTDASDYPSCFDQSEVLPDECVEQHSMSAKGLNVNAAVFTPSQCMATSEDDAPGADGANQATAETNYY